MTLEELRDLPTIRSGPAFDLKVQTRGTQVWVRRGDHKSPQLRAYYLVGGHWEQVGADDKLSTPIRNKIRMELAHERPTASVAQEPKVSQ